MVRVLGVLGLVMMSVVMTLAVAHAGLDQKASAFVLCKNQKSVRTIRVMPDSDQSNCTITYGKNGVEEIVGANRSLKTCKSILQSIRYNLQSSSWNCREISSATVTSSSEVTKQ
jgi:hypothetical protein